MKTKLLTLFVALVATTALGASNVITYTATEKLQEAPDVWSGYLYINAFNVAITSHEFSNGAGTITFAGEVTTIGRYAFSGCSSLTSVTIPNSITTIGDGAFYDCEGLTSVTIPNSVTTIGEGAFSKCKSLPVIDNIRYADTYVIEAVDKTLSTFTFKDGTKWIGTEAFYNCSSLISIAIPNSVTSIGRSAFSGCSNLTSITIPNSVISIGMWAFSGCGSLPIIDNIRYADTYLVGAEGSLSTYTIREGTKWIGDNAFDSHSLTSITIPNSVISIGMQAFRYCSNLTSVTIPNSVTTIGEAAFYFVNNIVYNGNAIGSPWGAKCINGYVDGYLVYSDASKTTLCGCSSAAAGEIIIPNSVTTIGEYTFAWCKDLTSVTIGNSVTTIGRYAFSGCSSLTSVTIPKSVTTIGEMAFPCVQTITIPNGIQSLSPRWLGDSYGASATVYVVISPFEYDNNPQSLESISRNIRNSCSRATLIPQPEEVATWTTTPTTIEMDIDLTNIPTTAFYDSISIDYFGEENNIKNILTPSTINHVIFTGLKPNQKNNIYYSSKKIGENDWKEGARLEIQLPELTLTTLVPKVVSAGTAVVAAETNISDLETNVGFEWRKYDAPESMPSKSGAAILFNGMMEGKLLNLSTDAYWNVRPYYEAADGTRYYGEWITFDPSDFSYFEPTVHTYALAISPTSNSVQVRGYVMTGTDEVTEQGFEYWINSAKAPNRVSSATSEDVLRVKASGQLMTAVLENLAYSSTYTCRAYAIAGGKTYYGEEVQFLTPEDPGTALETLWSTNKNGNLATKYFHNGNLIIERNGIKYTPTGQKVR